MKLKCFCIAFAFLFTAGCGFRSPAVSLEGKNIICFGDSITEGVGASPGEDFPSLLAQKFNRPVINAGKAGETTRDALQRIQNDVIEKNPGLVIVEFGGNDFLQKIPREETFENLNEIVRKIQQGGATVVLAAVRIGVLYDEYYAGFKRVAGKRKVLLIPDMMKGVFENPKYKFDGFHPNAAGYQIIAEKIYRSLKPLIKD